jgi:hypothetical protein
MKDLSQGCPCLGRDINRTQFGRLAAGANLLRVTDFSLAHGYQTAGRDPLGMLRCGLYSREADHSSTYSAEIKKGEATPLLPYMSSWYSA